MVNDSVIIYSIVAFFVIFGAMLPILQEEFDQNITNTTSEIYQEEITEYVDQSSSLNVWQVIMSIFSMFFWTFGNLHWVIDLFVFVPIRILLAFVVARNVWVGGGA